MIKLLLFGLVGISLAADACGQMIYNPRSAEAELNALGQLIYKGERCPDSPNELGVTHIVCKTSVEGICAIINCVGTPDDPNGAGPGTAEVYRDGRVEKTYSFDNAFATAADKSSCPAGVDIKLINARPRR